MSADDAKQPQDDDDQDDRADDPESEHLVFLVCVLVSAFYARSVPTLPAHRAHSSEVTARTSIRSGTTTVSNRT